MPASSRSRHARVPGPNQEEIAVVSNTTDAAVVRGIVQEWRSKNPQNSLAVLSIMTGVDFGVLLTLVNGGPLIDKLSAAKVLTKLGEPLRPDMAEALRESRRLHP